MKPFLTEPVSSEIAESQGEDYVPPSPAMSFQRISSDPDSMKGQLSTSRTEPTCKTNDCNDLDLTSLAERMGIGTLPMFHLGPYALIVLLSLLGP